MHYINDKEDVLVSLDIVPEEEWFRVPNLDGYYISQVIANDSLFIVSKMYCLAYKEFKEPTLSMTHQRWLDEYGYVFSRNQFKPCPQKYRNYDCLNLACLYGGNNRNFNIIKPFIIPAEYIQSEYNSSKIKEYISFLKKEGYIKI